MIIDWLEEHFKYPEKKLFLELGANDGRDTQYLASLPAVTLHAFEPNPNLHPPMPKNATLHRFAIGDHDGTTPFHLSHPVTYSSLIRKPKNHLVVAPNISFNTTITVDMITLDSFHRQNNLGTIDFIWADIQGAEVDMIRGGQYALTRTRYLYTEYFDNELYVGQIPLREILKMLPNFEIIEQYNVDVLLGNKSVIHD